MKAPGTLSFRGLGLGPAWPVSKCFDDVFGWSTFPKTDFIALDMARVHFTNKFGLRWGTTTPRFFPALLYESTLPSKHFLSLTLGYNSRLTL